MKKLAGMVLILLVMAIGYPLLNEETGSTCSALERRTLALLRGGGPAPSASDAFAGVLLGGVQSMTNGALARDEVRRRQPNLPAFAGCLWYYWDSLLDPEGFKRSLGG